MPRINPSAVVAEVERLSKLSLWPGFNPLAYPLALYVDDQPHLFRHPNPPADVPPAFAHTTQEIGGVLCATVQLGTGGVYTLEDAAATSVHELFHVFQTTRYPGWTTSEAARFTYPVENAQALALRRLETLALRRALEAAAPDASASWAAAFAAVRRERHALLPAESAAYEHGLEALEGTAYYIELMARGDDAHHLPEEEWPADAIRIRSYLTGRGIGLVLDRHLPDWKSRDFSTPAELLPSALGSTPAAQFTREEHEAAAAAAVADVAGLLDRRQELRAQFLAQPGETLELIIQGEPLRPRGFDPMNLHRLDGLELLHTRFLRLGSAAGLIEIFGAQALTLGAGPHPLYNGVKRVLLTGLPSLTVQTLNGGGIRLEGQGVKAEFSGAHVTRSGTSVIMTV